MGLIARLVNVCLAQAAVHALGEDEVGRYLGPETSPDNPGEASLQGLLLVRSLDSGTGGTKWAIVWPFRRQCWNRVSREEVHGSSLLFAADLVVSRRDKAVRVWLEEPLQLESLETGVAEHVSVGLQHVLLVLLRNLNKRKGSFD